MTVVDFDFAYDNQPVNIMLDLVPTTALDEQEKYIFTKIKVKPGPEQDYVGAISVVVPCTGSIDEALVIKNINQIMLNKKSSEKIVFHIFENQFLSPDFKDNLAKLAKYHRF